MKRVKAGPRALFNFTKKGLIKMYNYEYLKQKRIEKGLSTNEAARLLGMFTPNYCRLECGRYTNVPTQAIRKLHQELGVDLDYLFMVNQE